ncbi:MAG: DUF59 domain-containing protein [Gammaproteobacteria bacterium]|nr:MAG: DUF59 domain-containing protein [Gammaproteobacteria bacterium]
MEKPDIDSVAAAIADYYDIHLREDLISADVVKDIHIDEDVVFVDLEFGFPIKKYKSVLAEEIKGQIESVKGIKKIHVHITHKCKSHIIQKNVKRVDGIQNVILIGGGKGGVGRTAITANIAAAIADEGARVGIIDADLFKSDLYFALGIIEKIKTEKNIFIPVEKNGIKTVSIAGILEKEHNSAVWGSNKVSRILNQFLKGTKWGELDYLIVDMPSSSGDILKNILEQYPVSGAVVIGIPDEFSEKDIVRTSNIYKKRDVPLLGVIENKSLNICTKCNSMEHIFGETELKQVAKNCGTDIIGSLPYSHELQKSMDVGLPIVLQQPSLQISRVIKEVAINLVARLSQQPLSKT